MKRGEGGRGQELRIGINLNLEEETADELFLLRVCRTVKGEGGKGWQEKDSGWKKCG